jgi:hypothetical protein
MQWQASRLLAAKLAGSDSKDVALARVTGSFDIAMANAEGAHKVAIEQCLILAPSEQQSCKDRADRRTAPAIFHRQQ